jgi:hypothetical protein
MAVRLVDIRSTESRNKAYGKLLLFTDNTTHFRVDRLLGMLPSDGMQFRIYTKTRRSSFIRIDLFEARAILLGKLGRHDSALELYVYRLRDYAKAERYVDYRLPWSNL